MNIVDLSKVGNYTNFYNKNLSSKSIYPDPIEILNLNSSESKSSVKFNVLPYRYVSEDIKVVKYYMEKRFIKAYFERNYKTDMINSPDHLVFLSSLVHLQKMIYLYLCYEFNVPISISGKEKIKVWPTKINIDMKNLITKKKDLTQSIKIKALRKTGPKTYFGKCESLINDGESRICADAVIYIL
tara:strand:- start:281 stop:835 length:555 start_codon:yes stop_codon:yes gene_type:complete